VAFAAAAADRAASFKADFAVDFPAADFMARTLLVVEALRFGCGNGNRHLS
jgi:hypothetical protein